MVISATEFKKNLGKYFQIALEEDIIIQRNKNTVFKLSNLKNEKQKAATSIMNLLGEDCDI